MNKQHSILFLYSLAPEIKAELAARGSSAEGYIERIRHTNGVEVRNLAAEALANADNYSVIIIVAHHNETLDALILQDGTGLSLDALTNAIPKTFAGLLDISSCGTKALAKAVKERCPSCHVQAAASTAGLELRLFLYANLLPFITAHPDIDYHAAYVRALNEIKQAQRGQQDLKETTKLGGQKNTSVFSPLEVKRKATVPIHVFIHYDSEQKVVKEKVPSNTEIHINSESLRGVHVGDELTIRLSFIDNGETHHLRIEGPDEFKVRVEVEEEIIHHIFKVYVSAEYSSPNFAVVITFEKGNEMISSLPVFIDVTDYADASQKENSTGELTNKSLAIAIKAVQPYMYAKSAYAVLFRECCDHWGYPNNRAQFESFINEIEETYNLDYDCPPGTLTDALRHNESLKGPVDKWIVSDRIRKLLKAFQEVLPHKG